MEHRQPMAVASISLDAEKRALNSVAIEVDVFKPTVAGKIVGNLSATTDNTTATGGNDVRVLTVNEYRQAGYSLALSFWEDHTSRYFIDTPDTAHWTEKQKWDLHLNVMEYITYAHLLKGLVVSAGPDYDCVALWMPPTQNIDSYLTLLRSGMWRLTYQLSPQGRDRFFNEFLPLLTATKLSVLGPRDQDSWYLVYIGTKPSGRGKGYARKAIEYVTKMADETGKACYLESSSAVNRRIYGKMGFGVVKEIYLQRERKNVGLDIMVREPVGVGRGKDRDDDADSGVDVK